MTTQTKAAPKEQSQPEPEPDDAWPPAEPPASLVAAVALIQSRMPVVGKGQTATVQMKAEKGGGKYTFDYSDLSDVASAVYPLLGPVGLAFIAVPAYNEHGKYMLTGKLAHVSGDVETGQFLLPERGNPQEIGSAITYGRRYLLGCLTGITTGDQDDDGAAASRTRRGNPPARQQDNGRQQGKPEPDGPPTAGQVRARINGEGKRRNLTPSQIGDDYASWSQGESISEATPEKLQQYLNSGSIGRIATTEGEDA